MAVSRGSRLPRNFGGRTLRRRSSWEEGPGGTALTPLSASSVAFVGSAVQAAIPGITVVRIRGFLSWYLTLATSAGDGFQGAFGIGIATFAAVTAGITAVPTPITEASDENWLYHRFISIHGPVVSSTSLNDATVDKFEVDTKAMRKLDDGMAIYAAVEVVETGIATAELWFDSRALAKLP